MHKNLIITRAKYLTSAIILAFLLFVATIGVVLAEEDSLDIFAIDTGRFKVSAGAVGLLSVNSAIIQIDVPGRPVTATLAWTGRGPTGDDTITIDVNGAGPQSITADFVEQASANCCDANNYVYLKLLPAEFFTTGSNTLALSDLTINENHGATLMVISEDKSFPEVRITRFWGLDSFHVDWTDPYGPNSQLVCQQFPPAPDPRSLDFVMSVGGVESEYRANSIWYMTGSGDVPTDTIVDVGTEISTSNNSDNPYPLYSTQNQNSMTQYDLYVDSLTVPAGDTWSCFQIESRGDVPEHHGISALWHNLTTFFVSPPPEPTPTPTNTPEPTPTNTPPPPTPTDTPIPPTSTPTPTLPPTDVNLVDFGGESGSGILGIWPISLVISSALAWLIFRKGRRTD